MKAAKRLSPWLLCVSLAVAIPAFGLATRVYAAPAASANAAAGSQRAAPFLPLTASERTHAKRSSFRIGGTSAVTLRGAGRTGGAGGDVGALGRRSSGSSGHRAPLITAAIAPDDLTGFSGTAQASTIHSFGGDQEVTPPNEDIAAGPVDVMEVVNSTVEVFNRAGGILGAADLNSFMEVEPGYHSSDPRVIYDAGSGRFWLTITEVPNTFSGCPAMAPVLIAVSASSSPLPFTGWLVYSLPHEIFGGTTGQPLSEFGDQPGLGVASNTITVTFNDFACDLTFNGSEVEFLQKTDFEHDTGANALVFFFDGPFAPQPVQAFGAMATEYIVTNESDCAGTCIPPFPAAQVDIFTGTPEGQNVTQQATVFDPMTSTVVDGTGFLPPADQPSPGPLLQTNDDRFLNAVWENGQIWAADGTSCIPSGDSVKRDCLDYVEIAANSAGSVGSSLTNQLNNVGINNEDLFYPAVSLDASGDLFTVFDHSSTATFPEIMAATIPSGGTTLSAFQTLHSSPTYYNGGELFAGACNLDEGCRWGDYSGAAPDPANGNDVWVVSGSEDGSVEGACTTIHACWNTRIDQLTLAGPTITSLTPPSGPVAGGQTVTVKGLDFGPDTIFTVATVPIAIHIVTPETFTFVTPASATTAGGAVQTQAADLLGATTENPASTYTYVGLANYVPATPFRILDTRHGGGGALGPGAVRPLQVTGVGTHPVPGSATAVVLNVTEVSGSAASLLTIYPFGSMRPIASNLNFAARTVIPNLVTVTLGPGGKVDFYNALGAVDVVADVEGYFAPAPSSDFNGLFHPMAPVRVCDTRNTSPTPACRAHGALGSGKSMVVNVTGGLGIPGDGTAGAAVLNVTGVAGTAATLLSVFPTNAGGGCTFPGTSTLNLQPGAVAANRVMVQLGPATPGGFNTSVCVFNAAGTINVVLDANAWFGGASATGMPTGYQYQAIAPTRICDTRVASASCAKASLGPDLTRLIGVAGDGGVPAFGGPVTVVAVIANLTAVAPTQATILTVYPADLLHVPGVSDLNVNAGAVRPNLVVVALDTVGADPHGGDVYMYNGAGTVNAIIDLEGWFQ